MGGLGFTASAEAVVLQVSGTANVYGAGHSTAPGPGGGGGGILPPSCSFPGALGSEILKFSSVTGVVNADHTKFANNGPDGGGVGSTNTSAYGGISGIKLTTASMFLVGVFLSDAEPADPAPTQLNVTGITNATSFAPQLAQTFFIGDGLTGTGTGQIQEFRVPIGATRLFLGFSDGWAAQGLPGWYDDNSGVLNATLTITPEPCTLALFGLTAFALRRRS
jgi:hypothetical protein